MAVDFALLQTFKYFDFNALMLSLVAFKLGGGLNDPKLPKTKKSKCYQTFLGAVLCIKAGENFEFGE